MRRSCMPKANPQPISRDLVRIIRESSKVEDTQVPLSGHMRVLEERQGKALEFYLRACALRIEQSL